MKTQRIIRMLTIAGGLILTTGAIAGATLDIDWWTIDGGGEMWTTGGNFELSGTIGQLDAGLFVMTGGALELAGGFWGGGTPQPDLPGDCDSDGDIDLDDFGEFPLCLSGPQGGVLPFCECLDFDTDADVDLADFAAFQRAFTGP